MTENNGTRISWTRTAGDQTPGKYPCDSILTKTDCQATKDDVHIIRFRDRKAKYPMGYCKKCFRKLEPEPSDIPTEILLGLPDIRENR